MSEPSRCAEPKNLVPGTIRPLPPLATFTETV